MGYRLKKSVSSAELASALQLEHRGREVEICAVAPLDEAGPGDLTFCRRKRISRNDDGVVFICTPDVGTSVSSSIAAGNPRLAFVRALSFLEDRGGFDLGFGESAIHPSVEIGHHVVIEEGVRIGAGTKIEHGAVIHRGVSIGERCVIRANSVIGGSGFGFERDEAGRPIRFPHLGAVDIADDVEIGALNTVARGALSNTKVGPRTKTDDHIHIAHNVVIGADCLITACAEISGGVRIGDRVWIGPNVALMEQIAIGDDALVGLGAVVTKSVGPGVTVTGNPAEDLASFSQKRMAVKALLKE